MTLEKDKANRPDNWNDLLIRAIRQKWRKGPNNGDNPSGSQRPRPNDTPGNGPDGGTPTLPRPRR